MTKRRGGRLIALDDLGTSLSGERWMLEKCLVMSLETELWK